MNQSSWKGKIHLVSLQNIYRFRSLNKNIANSNYYCLLSYDMRQTDLHVLNLNQ